MAAVEQGFAGSPNREGTIDGRWRREYGEPSKQVTIAVKWTGRWHQRERPSTDRGAYVQAGVTATDSGRGAWMDGRATRGVHGTRPWRMHPAAPPSVGSAATTARNSPA